MSSVKGMRELQARLKAIGDTQADMRALQFSTIHEAQALVHRKTGHLQRSIVPGPVSDTSAVIEARTPYAASVEFGAKPHRIPTSGNARAPMPIGFEQRLSGRSRTRGGKMILKSGFGKGGKPPFAWHVNHPGNKPFPYLVPGAKKALEKAGILAGIVTRWNQAG